MQVWVWDSLGIQSLQEAQSSEEGWVGCRDLLVGASAAFSYRVGDSGCPLPRKFVIDLRHVGTSVRMALAVTNGNSALRIRVPTGRRCRLFRSTDLIQWEPLDTYYVGFFDCLNPSWRSCGAYPDLNGVERVVDLEVPPERWGSPSLRQATFLRLDVGQ